MNSTTTSFLTVSSRIDSLERALPHGDFISSSSSSCLPYHQRSRLSTSLCFFQSNYVTTKYLAWFQSRLAMTYADCAIKGECANIKGTNSEASHPRSGLCSFTHLANSPSVGPFSSLPLPYGVFFFLSCFLSVLVLFLALRVQRSSRASTHFLDPGVDDCTYSRNTI